VAAVLGPATRDVSPSWAPGRQIAFSVIIDDNQDINVMEGDGSRVRRLTKDPSIETSPAWSPDGTQLAFVREDSDGNQDVWLMNADGTKPHRLTTDAGRDASPAWSPDGKEIAFVSTRAGGTNIWLMEVDGSTQRPLTDSGRDIDPSWGKNGLIIFSRGRENHDIFAVNSSGADPQNLTKGRPSDDRAPSWSPSGTRIAFISEVGGEYEVWTMSGDGSGLTPITHGFQRLARRVTWSPDGKSVVFSAVRT
jgi:TolB protein